MRIILTAFLLSAAVSATAGQEPSTKVPGPKSTNIFGRESGNQTEVLVAEDVPAEVKKAIEKTLAAAVSTWGSSGRLEYWVLGTDQKAALKLHAKFCERRVSRGHMSERDCLADRLDKDHGFLMYQSIGAKALKSGQPRGSAGHNGGAQWGFHNMTSSLPLGFAGKLGIAGEDEQVTILHEYWHSVQNSFIQTREHERRRKLMGPVWFIEGSAVAMAEITAARLWSTGKLRRWKNGRHEWPSLKERMINKMKTIQSKRKECPTALPDSYDAPCRELAYEGGAWAIAYLLHRDGLDVLRKKFHPNVERLGWETAFKETFGQSSASFASEFEKFLDRPLDEQVRILRFPPSKHAE